MVDLTRNELDSLPVPLDFGPVLKTATQTGSKRSSKRSSGGRANGPRGDKEGHTLTKKHACIKHLYPCERSHRWQWVPEKRLSLLWHSLDNEERARLVQTHERDQLTRKFVEELEVQMRSVECFASESAKNQLAAMIWCDQSGLALFKRIFIIAVEQNHPMVIDMEVIAAVDAVIQDFCASVMKLKQRQRLPCSAVISCLLLAVLAFWAYGSAWTWLVALCAAAGSLHSIWRSLPPLDPRNFDVGSDLWVQYREREHVRLMWMSATVRVFEVRLLRILERRRMAAKLALAQRRPKDADAKAPAPSPPPPAAKSTAVAAAPRRENGLRPPPREARPEAAFPPPAPAAPLGEPMPKRKQPNQRRLPRRRKPQPSRGEAEDDEQVVRTASGATGGEGEAEDAESCPLQPPEACEEEEAEEGALEGADDLPAALDPDAAPWQQWREPMEGAEDPASAAQSSGGEMEEEDGIYNEDGGGDEIDAEFARRVQEHFQNRVQAAGKDLRSQTERGNIILKSLCERLKMELERTTGPP